MDKFIAILVHVTESSLSDDFSRAAHIYIIAIILHVTDTVYCSRRCHMMFRVLPSLERLLNVREHTVVGAEDDQVGDGLGEMPEQQLSE
jgi:hypothetical protein